MKAFALLFGAFLCSQAATVERRAAAVTLTVDPSKTMANNYKIGAMLEANLK